VPLARTERDGALGQVGLEVYPGGVLGLVGG